MAKTPEFVVTGVHVPGVHFWARVLVEPERLQRVKESVLQMGQVFLQPGEVLQVDTRGSGDGDEIRRSFTVRDYSVDALRATGLVAWNEVSGDITIYGDNADFLAAVAHSAEGVVSGGTTAASDKGVTLHSDELSSIQVGDVRVFFPRREEEERPESVTNQVEEERSFFRSRGLTCPPDIADEKFENDPDRYPSSLLKAGEKLRAPRGTAIRSGRSA